MENAASELELIQHAQQGDRVSLGQLLLMHHGRLVRHLSARMPPSASRLLAAEDIAQQAYARVFEDLTKFEYRGNGSFFAWLRTIGEHQLLNTLQALQARKRGGNIKHVETNTASESAYDLFVMLIDDGESPSLNLRRSEALDALQIALAELPEEYREVTHRHFLLGQDWEEVALALNKTPASVRSLAHRAKQRLRETLAKLSLFMSRR